MPAREPVAPGPWFVLVPEASVTFGTGIFAAGEMGGALSLRLSGFSLGIRGAASGDGTVSGGLLGCDNFTVCPHNRSRFGLTFESHVGSGRSTRPWVGVDLEALRVGGTRWTSELNPPEEHSSGALLTPKIGVDFLGQWPRGFAGFGLFCGIPMGGAGDAKGIGLVLGIRAPLGVLVARGPSAK